MAYKPLGSQPDRLSEIHRLNTKWQDGVAKVLPPGTFPSGLSDPSRWALAWEVLTTELAKMGRIKSEDAIRTIDSAFPVASRPIEHHLIRNFGFGNIRTVAILTVWSDGEVGGDYHIEGSADKAKLIGQFERMLRVLRGEEEAPPYSPH